MSANVQIIGLKELEADIQKAGYSARGLMTAALSQSANVLQRNIRQEAPIKTGSLKRSIMTSVSYPTATVTEQEKYGRMVEEGTRPHIILPKSKKALFWKGAFSPYKVVHHPGTKANPFFQRGIDRSKDAMLDPFIKVAEKLVTMMAGK